MRQFLRITATFTFMLVFTAGMAFGQTVATNQSGGSTADIEQTTTKTGVSADHKVIGDFGPGVNGSSDPAFDQVQGSQLEATQIGFNESAVQLLEGEQLNGTNEMYVQQEFGANEAKILQNGDGNLAKLEQRDGASAFISQQGDDNVVDGLRTNMLGVSNPGSGDTHAGNGNGLGSAVQTKNNVLTLYQRGNMNRLRFAQIDGEYNGIRLEQEDGSKAEIFQDGDGNRVEGQTQLTFRSFESNLYVEQVGDGNQVLGRQTAAGGSSIYVDQNGVSNALRVVQQ